MNVKKIITIIVFSIFLLAVSFFSGWIVCFRGESSKDKERDKQYKIAIDSARTTIAGLEESIAREKQLVDDATRRQFETEGRYNKLIKLIQSEGTIYTGFEESTKSIGNSVSIIEQELFKQ